MSQLKINNKMYDLPILTFRHVSAMDEMGGSNFITLFAYGKKFAALTRFVSLITGEDLEQSDHLVEQHVLGGGDLKDLVDAMDKAVTDSHFLQKAMKMNTPIEEESAETAEETEEVAEVKPKVKRVK